MQAGPIQKNGSIAQAHAVAKQKAECRVTVDRVENEAFNHNIRCYVDISPLPQPHDDRPHLHGGIPVAEIEQDMMHDLAKKSGLNQHFRKKDFRDWAVFIKAKAVSHE